ncbi:MAG: sn-glycerol-3-phosphate ABC transporter ATP-binding protein UgpC [Spirochaetes bacterium]|nr:sn-glycerol-3-phosphate ABC transporter ATP-binding protein UgpC [Spirochaetota bacterium]MBN2772575.1 sn-glycerol-3-phosphate ABC transporter ATP-binding protein UgpC [Spirochaetota bacterium]
MATVVLKDINKIYPNGFQAVYDANIEIQDKEFVILVGPSGCGKSTTLRMLAGLEEITSGDLYIDDKRVNDIHPKDRDIAMVFQNYALYPHMTVYDNMAFGLKMRKTPKDIIEKQVKEAAQILHIENLLDRKPKQLSGGQRQRVALGRAIVRHPKVFLFDEPLSNLDAKLRVTMRAEISRLHTKLQSTMVYVTHDQTEAMTMGDRIVVMKDGFIQQIDTPMELYNNPNNMFVAGFIGTPPMNFHPVSLTGDKLTEKGINLTPTPEQLAKLKEYGSKNIVFGVRPEDFTFEENPTNSINAVIEVVEPLGSETILHVRLDSDSNMVLKADPTKQFSVNQSIKLGVVISKCKFFDATDKVDPTGKSENPCIV